MLICILLIASDWSKMVGGGMRPRTRSMRGRSTTCRMEEVQEDEDVYQQAAVDATQ
jgi:hypothetical protein